MMLPNEYQTQALKTEIYSDSAKQFVNNILESCRDDEADELVGAERFLCLMYCAGKLNGEAGEIAENVFKAFRGESGVISEELRIKLLKELGDVQWYIATIADILGFTLDEVMIANILKLRERQERGVLHGYGDER